MERRSSRLVIKGKEREKKKGKKFPRRLFYCVKKLKTSFPRPPWCTTHKNSSIYLSVNDWFFRRCIFSIYTLFVLFGHIDASSFTLSISYSSSSFWLQKSYTHFRGLLRSCSKKEEKKKQVGRLLSYKTHGSLRQKKKVGRLLKMSGLVLQRNKWEEV